VGDKAPNEWAAKSALRAVSSSQQWVDPQEIRLKVMKNTALHDVDVPYSGPLPSQVRSAQKEHDAAAVAAAVRPLWQQKEVSPRPTPSPVKPETNAVKAFFGFSGFSYLGRGAAATAVKPTVPSPTPATPKPQLASSPLFTTPSDAATASAVPAGSPSNSPNRRAMPVPLTGVSADDVEIKRLRGIVAALQQQLKTQKERDFPEASASARSGLSGLVSGVLGNASTSGGSDPAAKWQKTAAALQQEVDALRATARAATRVMA
jgi:hypothetical protein